jgi:hypothetical protein
MKDFIERLDKEEEFGAMITARLNANGTKKRAPPKKPNPVKCVGGIPNREAGSLEENKAIVHGNLAYFGTYSVSDTDKTITTHIEKGTFPNWNGTDRKTAFTISGDELSTTVISGPSTSIGTGKAYLVWKRAK